ncbi:SDR family NAD(P)-dependent oxidoreductase [Cupriavidus sp. D39]|uniref:SDR family NAD(P)-dependent oxidoreductase n=1 Tax=Cupriavidus sp. D39 TaxID=2997877 RepID=UPI002271A3B7|nr:SDR family oxidoreductase [Cupriavidus sp. D39]MCY0854087.1 SDR family NAD(P)-dependent oxidoreductase [Cupriavidus sp. D39]
MSYAIYPSLKEESVVITGGGSGIGAEMVDAFARQGAHVHFIDVCEEDARQLQDTLAAEGLHTVFHLCDLRDVGATTAVFERITDARGPIGVLVNNAGRDDRHQINAVTPAYWEDCLAVNLRHQFFCAQLAAADMRTARKGVILNMGSASWHVAVPDLSIYMTAKAGIEGLTRGLARDLGRDGIRVNCIVPGAVRTPRQTRLWQTSESEARLLQSQCLPARIEPRHVASMALFLASDDGARCSGREYFVDAGYFGV